MLLAVWFELRKSSKKVCECLNTWFNTLQRELLQALELGDCTFDYANMGTHEGLFLVSWIGMKL